MKISGYKSANLIIFIGFLLNFNFFESFVKAQSSCTTPDNQNGHCVKLEQCEKYLNYLNQTLSLKKRDDFLRKSLCGGNPNERVYYICCNDLFVPRALLKKENAKGLTLNHRGLKKLHSMDSKDSNNISESSCTTPDNQNGHCVKLEQCEKYLNYLNQTLSLKKRDDFLRKSLCRGNPNERVYYICCNDLFVPRALLKTENAKGLTLNHRGLKKLHSMDSKDSNNISESSCTTPDNQNGHCVKLEQCEKYLNYLNQTLSLKKRDDFLRKSLCSGNPNERVYYICCNDFFISRALLKKESAKGLTLDHRGLEILYSMESCGFGLANRIAFGENTKLQELPWMALLEYETPSSDIYECGGSLITDRYVLTAAHCLMGVERIVAVILGEHNLDTDPDCQKLKKQRNICSPPRERYLVESLKPHPEYHKYQVGFDIALIKLNRVVKFKKHIKPICLPITPLTLEPQQRFTIAGWGTTEKGQNSRLLKKANVIHHSKTVCKNHYQRESITNMILCAGGGNPIDSCKGDSGGPLFISTLYGPSEVRSVQYGIISHGSINCSSSRKYPGLYTNVTEFLPWITRNIIH